MTILGLNTHNTGSRGGSRGRRDSYFLDILCLNPLKAGSRDSNFLGIMDLNTKCA